MDADDSTGPKNFSGMELSTHHYIGKILLLHCLNVETEGRDRSHHFAKIVVFPAAFQLENTRKISTLSMGTVRIAFTELR